MSEVRVQIGFTTQVAIRVVDQYRVNEQLASADRATFVVRRSSAEAPLLTLSTNGTPSQLSIDVPSATLNVTILDTNLTTIPAGTYSCSFAIRFGSESAWYASPEFDFVVLPQTAVRS